MGRLPACFVLVALLVPTTLAWLPTGTADSASTLASPSLPSPRAAMPAVTHGEHVYLFGGCRSTSSSCLDSDLTTQILRFTPSTGQVRVMNATMPSPVMQSSAVSTGSVIYVFGGFVGGPSGSIPFTSVIMRYDPATDMIAWAGNLPSQRGYTSAVWDGTSAWIFGGRTGSTQYRIADIVRFDPATGSASTVKYLPSARTGIGTAFDGRDVYLFGGAVDTGYLRDVLRFNVTTRALTTLTTQLPVAYAPGANGGVWSGSQVFLVGGSNAAPLTQVYRFNTSSSTIVQMAASVPSGRISAPVAIVGSAAYMFGGFDGASYRREIQRYTWEPGAPQNATATSFSRFVNVSWQAPATNTYAVPPAAYEIWRSVDGSALARLATIGTNQTFLDRDVEGRSTYTYRIRAVNADGASQLSAEATILLTLPPSAPQNLTARLDLAPTLDASPRVSLGPQVLAWEAPLSDGGLPIEGYRVYRNESDGERLLGTTAETTFTDETCALLRECVYRVRAFNAVGEGENSADASTVGNVLAPRVDPEGVYNDADGSGARGEEETLVPAPQP